MNEASAVSGYGRRVLTTRVFQKPVYSGLVMFFVAAPLAVLWNALGDAWIGIAALVFAAVALVLVPIDVRRNAFRIASHRHPASFSGPSLAIGIALPIIVVGASILIYLLER